MNPQTLLTVVRFGQLIANHRVSTYVPQFSMDCDALLDDRGLELQEADVRRNRKIVASQNFIQKRGACIFFLST